jgi:hypothetical protein
MLTFPGPPWANDVVPRETQLLLQHELEARQSVSVLSSASVRLNKLGHIPSPMVLQSTFKKNVQCDVVGSSFERRHLVQDRLD